MSRREEMLSERPVGLRRLPTGSPTNLVGANTLHKTMSNADQAAKTFQQAAKKFQRAANKFEQAASTNEQAATLTELAAS